jgi:hypothetical protein
LRHAEYFASLCDIVCRHFLFWEDGFVWAFWDACPTIDTSVWINVEPGPLLNRFTGNDALDRAYIHT